MLCKVQCIIENVKENNNRCILCNIFGDVVDLASPDYATKP